MDKQSIIEFFDRLAPEWDANMIRDDEKINKILDCAGIIENASVLDVACGTGVLIQDILNRNVSKVIGVDISPAMIEIANKKYNDFRAEFICSDVEVLSFDEKFDCCLVYNAFPHFPDPEKLIKILAEKLSKNGRLTIAHGMSREDINQHHSGKASDVSRGLPSEKDLSALMEKYLKVDTVISNENIYIVSAYKC